jgi:hypothetical protein
MTVHQRHQLWKNACGKSSTEANGLKELIESCGLPYSEAAALKSSDPLAQKMIEIINSTEAIEAAIKATEGAFQQWKVLIPF